MNKPLIISDKNSRSQSIKRQVIKILNKKNMIRMNVVIVIGGDGFMLQTLKRNKKKIGFFMGLTLEAMGS